MTIAQLSWLQKMKIIADTCNLKFKKYVFIRYAIYYVVYTRCIFIDKNKRLMNIAFHFVVILSSLFVLTIIVTYKNKVMNMNINDTKKLHWLLEHTNGSCHVCALRFGLGPFHRQVPVGPK
jgi:hypothetical protein